MCVDRDCPDPVEGTTTADGEIDLGELDEVVLNVTLTDEGKKTAETRSHYSDADWASRQNAKDNFPDLFSTYLRLEAKGVYPKPSLYNNEFNSVGSELSSGWNRGFTAMDENAQWIMNTSVYAIGGTLAVTVGGGVFLEAGEAGSLSFDFFGANGGFGHTIGRTQRFYRNLGLDGGTIFHYQNAARMGQVTRYFRLDSHLVKRASGEFVKRFHYHSAKRTLGQMSTRAFRKAASIHKQIFTGKDFTTF